MGKSQKYHLRKIVGHQVGGEINGKFYPGILFEVLECGHKQQPLSDAYGETTATSRRCIRCPKDKPGEGREE